VNHSEVPGQGTLVEAFDSLLGPPQDVLFQFEDPAVTVTQGEFSERVRRVASGLQQLGVKPGDTVAGLLDNGPALIEMWFATLVLGGVWVPINTALRGGFLAHVLRDCGAGVLAVEDDLIPLVHHIRSDLETVPRLIRVSDSARRASTEDESSDLPKAIEMDWLRSQSHCDALYAANPSDLACLIYTSGTTGPSKGCMLPHGYLVSLSQQGRFDRQANEPVFTALPLYHLNAMTTVILTIMLGGRAMIGRRFSVSNFWPMVEKSAAKFVNLLGPMAMMLANAPDNPAMQRCKGQIRRVLSAPFPEHAQDVFRSRFGVSDVNSGGGYGLTEAGLLAANPDWAPQPAGASGKRWHMFDVRIVDDGDAELPPGEIGEIVCRPNYPNIMFKGYWGRPEDTLKAFRNLWFHTGDLGRFDSDGFFYFVDRKKDYLRRRGENISSMEVEAVLHQHPDVAEVAVYGVPSELGEDEVQASVVLGPGSKLSERELCVWSVELLPHFAVPRFIEICDALPKTPTGRVRKVELKAREHSYPRWDREHSDVVLERRR
jgi:carnitine-CoA ligase